MLSALNFRGWLRPVTRAEGTVHFWFSKGLFVARCKSGKHEGRVWCCLQCSEEFKACDWGWKLRYQATCRVGKSFLFVPVPFWMSCPCTSRAVLTSAALSAMNSFTLLLLPIKCFLALSAKHSPQITSVVTLAGNSHFTMARLPGQLAGICIYWNSTSDETHQCLRQSDCPCLHLPGPSTSSSVAPSDPGILWPLSSPQYSHYGLPYRNRQITR